VARDKRVKRCVPRLMNIYACNITSLKYTYYIYQSLLPASSGSRSHLVMFSQQVWLIEELVRLICAHTLEYRIQSAWQYANGHDYLVLDASSRQTLAGCVLFLNRFISRIAIEVLWKDLNSFEPLRALLPLDYCPKVKVHKFRCPVSCLYRCTH